MVCSSEYSVFSVALCASLFEHAKRPPNRRMGPKGSRYNGSMKSSALQEKRRIYVQGLETTLQRIREEFSRVPGVQAVWLFGSYARGRRDLLTDLDIVVVWETDLPFLERLRALRSRIETEVDLDLLCYTPEEFRRLQETPFGKRILKEGVCLYAKAAPGRRPSLAGTGRD